MPYLLIEDFRAGLDARRFKLALPAGTLTGLQNAHITAGAEIEKRKAFIRTSLPANTFGLEFTDSGIITFGSNADPGGWPRGDVTSYQRLQHPAVQRLFVPHDGSKHDMTAVVFSRCVSGKAFVCATFTDGFSFLFYDGVSVPAWYSGLVLSGGEDVLYAATDLEFAVARIPGWLPYTPGGGPWSSDGAGGNNAFESDGAVDVTSPVSVTFALVITKTTAAGQLSSAGSAAAAAVPGTGVAASFTVNGGAGKTYDISAPVTDQDGNNVVANYPWINQNLYLKLVSAPVAWAATNNATATAIAAAISALTATTGYSASALGAVVTVTGPAPLNGVGNVPNPLWVTSADGTAAGAHIFAAGTQTTPAYGQTTTVAFAETWVAGETWTISVVATSGDYTLGRGYLGNGWWASGTVKVPTCCLAFSTRVFIGNGNQFNFSALSDPTGWDQQNIGAGFVSYTSNYGSKDSVKGFAPFQGGLAVTGRQSVQIWGIDADPNNFVLRQTLVNIGTFAPDSVQAVGDFDVLLLHDSGFRSIRVRAATNDAMIADVGTPIDALVQALLQTLTEAEKAVSCGIVEPTANRFWGFVPGHAGAEGVIYVFTYFPSSQVSAWGTYRPTYQTAINASGGNYNGSSQVTYATTIGKRYAWTPGAHEVSITCGTTTLTAAGKQRSFTATAGVATMTGTAAGAGVTATLTETDIFAPQKFLVANGKVYARSSDAVLAYGGADGNTYENCGVTADTPFMSAETPATRKNFRGVDAGFEGTWLVSVGTNLDSDTDVKLVYANTKSSWALPAIPIKRTGTHLKLHLVEDGNGYGRFSSATVSFEQGEEK